MGNALLSNEELQERVNIHHEPKLRKWLNDNRIAWLKDGKGRPITTLSAIERVLFGEDDEEVGCCEKVELMKHAMGVALSLVNDIDPIGDDEVGYYRVRTWVDTDLLQELRDSLEELQANALLEKK